MMLSQSSARSFPQLPLLVRLGSTLLLMITLAISTVSAHADGNPFAGGWTLDQPASSLTFQTIKNGSKLETSSFASYQGSVDASGRAELRIQLDSVDTKVDLRNVRMRFLLFETFKYAEAVVTTTVDPASVATLAASGRLSVPLTFELDLHGIKRSLTTNTVVTALAGNQVSVASAAPISIATELFGLDEGVKKLEEAANVQIVPMGSVSFNLVFNTGGAATQPVAVVTPANAAVETAGDLNEEECVGRFEILSRAGGIYFGSGSAKLDPESELVLETIIDVVDRCSNLKIIVAGHTDAAGAAANNQILSESRAESVMRYIADRANVAGRIRALGYGESQPVASNDTARNRRLNRRIEFLIDG